MEEVERIVAAKNDEEEPPVESGFSITGFISSAVSSLIPTSALVQDRAFATIQLKEAGLRHQVVLVKLDMSLKVLVACEDGFLYVYDFDEEKGGDCKICQVHDVRGNLHGVIGKLFLVCAQPSFFLSDNHLT